MEFKMLKRVLFKINHEALKFRVKHAPMTRISDNYNKGKEVVVSLTSFPKRIPNMDMCIKSLLLQSVRPNKIVIYLGSDSAGIDYDKYFSKFYRYGVEVRLDKENDFKSHKKYLYTFKDFPHALIVTADDDLIYHRDMIESLLKKHDKFPEAVVARRVYDMRWDGEGNVMPYSKWKKECISVKEPSFNLFVTTGAGTLFPPGVLNDTAFDTDLIKKLSFGADDIWLKVMEVMSGTKVVWAGNLVQMPSFIDGSQDDGLYQNNVEKGMNDKYIKNLMDYFHITREDFNDDK